MQTVIDQVNNSLPDVSLTADCFVNSLNVNLAVTRLKLHKSEAGSGLSTDHFVYAGDECFKHISILLTSIIADGRVQNCFCIKFVIIVLRVVISN